MDENQKDKIFQVIAWLSSWGQHDEAQAIQDLWVELELLKLEMKALRDE